jgi:hypothetical protein
MESKKQFQLNQLNQYYYENEVIKWFHHLILTEISKSPPCCDDESSELEKA